mmetsp:Transcript_9041/g.13347  ORF Transcript_9041/g.13347 Transcript_9041/m.13347 type:complete len:538 (-) Transcript_9041:326-1939(-)
MDSVVVPPQKKQKVEHYKPKERKCTSCEDTKTRYEFSKKQWNKGPDKSRCTACISKENPLQDDQKQTKAIAEKETHEHNEKIECTLCKKLKARNEFSWRQLQKGTNKCSSCILKAECFACETIKPKTEFHRREISPNNVNLYRCKECVDGGAPELRKCSTCQEVKPANDSFSPKDSKCTLCLAVEREALKEKYDKANCMVCGLKQQRTEMSVVVSLSGRDPRRWKYVCQNDETCSEKILGTAEEIIAIRQEEELDDRLREGAECIQKALEIRKKTGCVAYNFAGTYDVICDNLEEEPHPFLSEAPSKESLMGVYDIIFHSRSCYNGRRERTSRGTLILSDRGGRGMINGSETLGLFNVSVDIDSMTADDCEDIFLTTFNLEAQPRSPQGDELNSDDIKWAADIKDLDTSGIYYDSDSMDELEDSISGELLVIDEPIDLPWLVLEGEDISDRCTIEEAEEFLQRPDYSESWLCQDHSPLPSLDALAAQHIHEYVTWRPDPIFSFEPGDVWLRIKWPEPYGLSIDLDLAVYIIARKRKT